MIDLESESLVGLADAAKDLTGRFQGNGRKIHNSTIWRWASKGVGGIVLETAKLGGSRVTSREALARFFEALGGNDSPASTPHLLPVSPSAPSDVQSRHQRQRRAAAADHELEKLGI